MKRISIDQTLQLPGMVIVVIEETEVSKEIHKTTMWCHARKNLHAIVIIAENQVLALDPDAKPLDIDELRQKVAGLSEILAP